MIENNRIIIVDDNEEHLNQLRQVFYDHGIGCKAFLYNGFDFPKEPLKGVRFAFFDIHLNQAGDINSTLKDAIANYISIDNGPYVLTFWSSHVDNIANFIDFVNRENDDFRNKLKPICLTSIDKSEFLDPQKDLSGKVDSILSTDLVKCIIKFDESVLTAAQQTLNRILDIIPFTDDWGTSAQFNTICKNIFSKIAETACGLTHAKNAPDMAVKEAIVPIFKHLLLHNEDDYWNEYLTPLQDARKSSDIKFPDNFSIEKLNSILHIDDYNLEKKTIFDRGAVCSFLKEKFEDNFERLFGISYTNWFSLTFPGVNKEIRQKSIPIAVEFSAACDYSQNKKRTNKYILGVLYPMELKRQLKEEYKGEYAFLLPFNFEFQSEIWSIGLNFNYTFTIVQTESPLENSPLFLLTKELMDTIGHKYASHVSRIGFTSFD